jgi:hypothetical protein
MVLSWIGIKNQACFNVAQTRLHHQLLKYYSSFDGASNRMQVVHGAMEKT